MKKKVKSIAVLFIFAVMASCGGSNNPESVAKDFLVALGTQDYETAKELGTKRTTQLVTFIESMTKMAKESGEDTDMGDMPDFEMTNCEIDGDKATCYYATDGKEDKIQLIKVDGEWKVDMAKEQ